MVNYSEERKYVEDDEAVVEELDAIRKYMNAEGKKLKKVKELEEELYKPKHMPRKKESANKIKPRTIPYPKLTSKFSNSPQKQIPNPRYAENLDFDSMDPTDFSALTRGERAMLNYTKSNSVKENLSHKKKDLASTWNQPGAVAFFKNLVAKT